MFFTFCWQQLIKWTNLDCQLTLCNDFLPFGGILVLHLNHLWPCRCFPIIPPLISLQKTLDLPLFLVLFDQRRSSKTKALLSILHFPKQPPSLESSVSLLLLDPNRVKRSSSQFFLFMETCGTILLFPCFYGSCTISCQRIYILICNIYALLLLVCSKPNLWKLVY